MRRGWRCWMLGAGLLLGCARGAAPEHAAAPERSVDARAAVATPDAAAPADADSELAKYAGLTGLAGGHGAGKCGEIEEAWSKLRAAGGQCTRAADCTCTTSSLWAPFGQSAMDVVRAKEMRKLAAQFSRRSCPTACVQGRPVPCRATCEDGRCVDVNARALPAEGLPRRRAR